MEIPGDDPKRRKPDITLAKFLNPWSLQQQLDWEPRVELEIGLQNTIEYFKSLDMRFYRKPTPHTAHKSSIQDKQL
ncbi:hypothetical protein ACHHYP_06763 [Achlya hypogyna]|uniref:NAD(P)-binding domain-containing protein n=1 Tax=Achlya hypogyna TaxID=1202772 RepID=A0A1V9YS35_ACHHY|nr:hypothetical protein ACHHYP_06763 [Achlya hypogyna]